MPGRSDAAERVRVQVVGGELECTRCARSESDLPATGVTNMKV